jgi:hypothetical protein
MFGDYSKDLLRAGIIELKAGNRQSARRYFDRCVYMSNDHDVMAEAWYWLSQTIDGTQEKRQALENCLANDLHHARARRALAVLDGRLNPDEIIDPNAPIPPAGLEEAHAQQFTCAKCGGRMVYSPDGRSLVCEYCRRHERVNPASSSISENDFVLTMATRRGHSRPLREQVRRCQGCSAEFIRPAAEVSFNCPYCDSSNVLAVDPSGDVLAPDGLLPHVFEQRRAHDMLEAWLQAEQVTLPASTPSPRGLYLPVWTFTLGGGIDYTGETTADVNDALRGRPQRAVQVHDQYPVMLTLTVAASRRPSAPFVRLIPGFDLGAVKPYDARYLADWPAELYDVPMAEASLEARSQAYIALQRDLPTRLEPIRVLSTSSANLIIESFRLDLLPVWICEVPVDGHARLVLINGQNGAVAGEGLKPPPEAKGGALAWLGDLLAD